MQSRPQFFAAAREFAKANIHLLMRLYGIIVLVSIAFNLAILRYGRIRQKLNRRGLRWLRSSLAVVILPRISEWHVILSPMLLPERNLKIRVDVMTKRGVLYDGGLREKMLSSQGVLHSITLDEPRRFKFNQYVEARNYDSSIKKEDYWTRIPGESFVILASVIETLNIRHAPATVSSFDDEEIIAALQALREKLRALQPSVQSSPRGTLS